MNLVHIFILNGKNIINAQKTPIFIGVCVQNGDPGGIRTPDPLIRSQIL